MKIFVITACYNYSKTLESYIQSLNNALEIEGNEGLELQVIFINDDVGIPRSILTNSLKALKCRYTIIENDSNIGCTRSRNKGVRYILSNLDYTDEDWLIYFDIDDRWDALSISYLRHLNYLSNKSEVAIYPVDVASIPINKDIIGVMPSWEFTSYVPMQEGIYAWNMGLVRDWVNKYGSLWYEDNSDSRYFPEDIMFLREPNMKLNILGEVICHRNYSTGNIAGDWGRTIYSNKSAFKKWLELKGMNIKRLNPTSSIYKKNKEYMDYVRYVVNK